MRNKIEFYKRAIDDGHGWQEVTVVNDIIEHQEIFANQGYYEGGGDPEFVNQHKKILRGRGFKKVRKDSRDYSYLIDVRFERLNYEHAIKEQIKQKLEEAGLKKVEFYKRLIDDGHGWQEVTVVNDIIEHQSIHANSGYYEGGGDPEFVGQHKKILRGRGFKKVKKDTIEHSNMLDSRYYRLNSEVKKSLREEMGLPFLEGITK